MDLGDANIRALRVLGEGSFGRVFLCVERNGPKERKVCVKRIIMRNPKNQLRLIKEEVMHKHTCIYMCMYVCTCKYVVE